jgi:predicted phosphodiesterase
MNTLEDVIFLGDHIPTEVLRILPILPHISTRSLSKVISLAVIYLTGELDKHKQELTIPLNQQLEAELTKAWALVKKKKKSDEQHIEYALKTGLFSVLFTGFFYILRAAIRQKMAMNDYEDQLKKLMLPEAIAKLLLQAFEKKYNFTVLLTI